MAPAKAKTPPAKAPARHRPAAPRSSAPVETAPESSQDSAPAQRIHIGDRIRYAYHDGTTQTHQTGTVVELTQGYTAAIPGTPDNPEGVPSHLADQAIVNFKDGRGFYESDPIFVDALELV